MSEVYAVRIANASRDEAPHIQTHEGDELTALLDKWSSTGCLASDEA
ncbi:hypothetical protein [Streptomyces sp. NPDC046978]